MLRGLPSSGKSTWAAEQAKEPTYKRVNKDLLREMADGEKWSGENEKEILRIRDILIERWLKAGFSVLVDDTNLDPKHEIRLRALAKSYDAPFEIEDFEVSLDEAIARDLKRQNSVGEKIIRQMHQRYLLPKPNTYTPPEGKPPAILCDIDGTLAHGRFNEKGKRSPYEWHRVGEDQIDPVVREVLQRYDDKCEIILLSGRDACCRAETEKWLKDNNVYYAKLYMRTTGDERKDTVIKKEIFETEIQDKYKVKFVLDDRKQVVRMWQRELGLKVLNCADDVDDDF